MMKMEMRLQKSQVSLPLTLEMSANGSFDRSLYSEAGYTNYEAILIGGCGGESGQAFGNTAQTIVQHRNGGGGGGSLRLKGKLADLPPVTPITVGSGGPNGTDSTTRGQAGAGGKGGDTVFNGHTAFGGGGGGGANWSISSTGSIIFLDTRGEGGQGGSNHVNLGAAGYGAVSAAKSGFTDQDGNNIDNGDPAGAGTYVVASPQPDIIGGGRGGGGGTGAVDFNGNLGNPKSGADGSSADPGSATYGSTASVVSAINAAATIAAVATALAPIGSFYGCNFSLKTTTNGATTGVGWTAMTSADLARVKSVAIYYAEEFAKYPKAFVLASGLIDVALAKTISFNGVQSGGSTGGAFSWQQSLYMALPDNASTDADNLRRVIHHEFWHIVDGAFASTKNNQETQWRAANGSGYLYKEEGGTARPNLADGHPLGFIDDYAQTNYAEDRAQIHSALMAEPRYSLLKGWMANDPGLTTKVNLIKTMSAQINSYMSGSYWDNMNAGITVGAGNVTCPGNAPGTNKGGGGGGANAGVIVGGSSFYGVAGGDHLSKGGFALKIS